MRAFQEKSFGFCRQLVRLCRRHWGRSPWLIRIAGMLIILGISMRGAAYLVPIHVEDLAQVDQAIEFRDRNARPLGTLLSRDQEHTAVVPLEQVSPHFRQAILSAEDQRFYQRGPVDLRAVIRARPAVERSQRLARDS